MRRVISIILFVLGGWMLTGEIATTFLDLEPGLADSATMIGIFAILAGIPLLLGAWASPGRRWRELGLTILIAVGLVLFCAFSMGIMMMDREFMRYMPPMPEMQYAPLIGIANVLVVGGAGWLLYRGRAGIETDDAETEGIA